MERDATISEALRADMESKGIDVALTSEILEGINAGRYGGVAAVEASGVPPVDGRAIVPAGADMVYRVNRASAVDRLGALGLGLPAGAVVEGGTASLDRRALVDLGERLYPMAAWGVLNGGSATSYADRKKNASLGPGVLDAVADGFELLSPLCEGRPKGVTPAYVNPDGSPGEGFLVLKMRAALLRAARYSRRFGRPERPALPFFQMTSDGTDSQLAAAYSGYAGHPWLAPLIAETGTDPTRPRSARQPMLAAFTHSSEGSPRRVFDGAYGRRDCAIALPGGHGQGFRVLADVYRGLLADGYRYAYIGNVDNAGYYPDPAELAVMALSGAEAAFEFSYRTPVDIKGGILVTTPDGRRTVADIGQAISFERVKALEASGERALFNCATGLFDLTRLVPRLDEISANLPVRVSDQDKDAGRYSQAEQSTWEVVGLYDEPLGFAVEKGERFIAAKLLAETILASGAADASRLPADVAATAAMMARGLESVLAGPCGLELAGGAWRPR
ncbi:MAG: UTP--glucose-1-phosphate uridylyltransferase [Spirochaetes bacterium]|nr:UTP--glucose-1-phosphate uridylyltransferase [Spirochaetota bacterium]MBU1079618.1 UTP--glucose-1-phosphate uridylyltransferase [Spirochaetota bacterium]